MMILWYVSVEDMILNGSSSFEIFWTTDYVDSKVRKVHANFPIQIGIFSNIFEKWQGKNFLKQGKNFHTSDKVKTSSNKVKRSQGKNFLKQGKNFHRIWQGIYRHRRVLWCWWDDSKNQKKIFFLETKSSHSLKQYEIKSKAIFTLYKTFVSRFEL